MKSSCKHCQEKPPSYRCSVDKSLICDFCIPIHVLNKASHSLAPIEFCTLCLKSPQELKCTECNTFICYSCLRDHFMSGRKQHTIVEMEEDPQMEPKEKEEAKVPEKKQEIISEEAKAPETIEFPTLSTTEPLLKVEIAEVEENKNEDLDIAEEFDKNLKPSTHSISMDLSENEEIEIISEGIKKEAPIIEEKKESETTKETTLYEDLEEECEVQGVLFESIVDNAQNFTITKWQIISSACENLIGSLSDNNEVIGVYGCEEKCVELLSKLLNIKKLSINLLKDVREGIAYFYSQESRRLCLYFKCRNQQVYIDKPFPNYSKEFIFVRLLFDICSAVVCCPPKQALDNWYQSNVEGEQNPFVPKLHLGMDINLERQNIGLSDIEEVKVSENLYCYNRWFLLSFDSYFHIFTVKKYFQNRDSEVDKIFKARTKLFHSINTRIQKSGFYSFIESLENLGIFHTFKSSCERSIKEIHGVLESIKSLYRKVNSQMIELLHTKFNEFTDSFKALFEYKNDKGFFSSYFSNDLENAKQNLLRFQFNEFKTKSKYLSSYIFNIKFPEETNRDILQYYEDGDTYQKRLFIQSEYEKFIDYWDKEIRSAYQSLFTTLINEAENKSSEIIENSIDVKMKYTYSFETAKIIITEAGIQLKSSGIENKYTTECDFSNIQIISFSENIAYLLLSNEFQTEIVQFNPTQNYTYETNLISRLKSDFILASGSSPNLFLAFQNSLQKAYYGAIQQGKYIDKGSELKVYREMVQKVNSACILPKKRRVLLLNEEGFLFYIELLSQDKLLHPVKISQLPEESKDMHGSSDYLRSQSGLSFLEVKCSVDETTYLLRTTQDIELYDVNFKFLKKISIGPNFVGFKCLTDNMFNYIIIYDQTYMFKAYRFLSEREFTNLKRTIKKRKNIPGNPAIDIIHFALSKFGKKINLINNGDSDKEFFVYCDIKNVKVDQYIKSIVSIKQSLRYQGFIYPYNLQRLEELANDQQISKEVLTWIIQTRQPLHLASIQEGNLIPLQNGLNNAENLNEELDTTSNFIETFVDYIKLGNLENLISSANNIRVIAIIGKQSSGKSYLLNRIFGTRFDVAAHRCTDGIWISLANIEGQLFVIMDCEGLFSIERTVQEEIKLCLFLSAVADVTILNQDLTFNRNLTYLFEKFTFGMDRLNGSALFQGKLEVALRDVGENQDEEALVELEKFIRYLTDCNKADFLLKLFKGQFSCSSYHNYENEKLFDSAVEARKLYYLENVPIRWKSGKELLITLKTVLAQIYADDTTSIDDRTLQIKIAALKKYFKEIIQDPSSAKEVIKPESMLLLKLEFIGRTIEINIAVKSVTLDLKETLSPFKKILHNETEERDNEFYHNEWYTCIDLLIKEYFILWKQEMLNYFTGSLPKSSELAQYAESEIASVERDLDKIINQHSICGRKCSKCDRICLKIINHASECDCTTNHCCPFKCSICEDSKDCAFPAGHHGEHMCNMKKHICGNKCLLYDICNKECIKNPNHNGDHMCGESKHSCGKKCELFDYCKRKCDKECLENHPLHDCGQSNCPLACCMKDCGMTCASQNHLHSLSEEIEFPQESETREQIHICNRTHKCENICKIAGICKINIKNEVRIFDNGLNKFPYHYTHQEATKSACGISIPQYKIRHEESHECPAKDHTCEEKCPDCDAFCKKLAGHEGSHFSPAHRNKEKCIYIAKKETFDIENEDDEDLAEGVSKKTIRILKAGEAAKPDFCDQSCLRKGRGHSHPLECPGGTRCYAKTLVGLAVHSSDRYQPNPEIIYDLLQCTAYWRHYNWDPPVESKNPEAQQLFSKCPYFCNSPDHAEKIYCNAELYHTFSDKYGDHDFPCHHEGSSSFDICFILDCTGSMSSSFPKVKEIITMVVNNYLSRGISTKFAIVGYTDHHTDSGGLDPLNPVTIYPPSRNLNDFNKDASLSFLSSLNAGGGGAKYGEAMIDGIYNANRLQWRPSASRIYFIIADDSPHGKEFYDNTQYPDGCPCGHKWKNLLQDMKSQKTLLKLVKLSNILNKTADLFKAEYGGNMEVITLAGMTNLVESVVSSIVSVIEHNLEFARVRS